MTNAGFDCLTNVELSLFSNTNMAYYSGYSTLKDVCNEYYKTDNGIIKMYNPRKGSLSWYRD